MVKCNFSKATKLMPNVYYYYYYYCYCYCYCYCYSYYYCYYYYYYYYYTYYYASGLINEYQCWCVTEACSFPAAFILIKVCFQNLCTSSGCLKRNSSCFAIYALIGFQNITYEKEADTTKRLF